MARHGTDQAISSEYSALTAARMQQTGLDERVLGDLVHLFYRRARADDLLGPIFAAHIGDWGPHLERMVAFWSSVALATGRYHGRPVEAHVPLSLESVHFDRWLELFRATAQEVCPTVGAALVIDRAEQIAGSLQIAIRKAHAAAGDARDGTDRRSLCP